MRGKPLRLQINASGCITPSTHKLNHDGYFRYRIHTGEGRGPLVMFHRRVWEKTHGPIPEGYEVDHLCKNRACCNIKHLRLLEGSAHAIETNETRYASRKEVARKHWESNKGISGTTLGYLFGVSFSAACRWIREWKV